VKETLSFDDVLLVPQYSNIMSRTEVDISNKLDGENIFTLPVISSPMDTITGTSMATSMASHGGLGIVHRYNSIEEQVLILSNVEGPKAAAIGMTGDYVERSRSLVDEGGAKILCVDVAHGHHVMMERCLKTLKDNFGDTVHIMAGNVATLDAFDALASWGADSVRVGIGGGSICSTRLVSGHGVPTFQSVLECARTEHDAKIIADGGIKTVGDMVKAYAAGADFVMVGSMLAGTKETPGQTFENSEGKKYKVYRGMASSEAQTTWRGKSSTPEGVSTTVPYKGKVSNILNNITGGIKSGFSYSGAKTFKEFQSKASFIRQTNAGQKESFTHILLK
jgi:IMP dehydrogenase